jgi:hypothetical protein
MNGTSGFQEVQVFTPRSQSYRYRFLNKKRHRFGTPLDVRRGSSWEALHTLTSGGFSMITIRRLLLFSCLALLGGCANGPSDPCRGPNEGYHTGRYCHSRFQITNIDMDNYIVQGVVPDEVFEEAKAPIPKSKKTFALRLHDWSNMIGQIKVKGTYDFGGEEDSPYVELLPDSKYLEYQAREY